MDSERPDTDNGMEKTNVPARTRRSAVGIQSGVADSRTGLIYEEPESRLRHNRSGARYVIQYSLMPYKTWHDFQRLPNKTGFEAAHLYHTLLETSQNEESNDGIITFRILMLEPETKRYRVLQTHEISELQQ